MPELDLSLLRTLVAVHERGSFARAARQVGRSESAVSLQLKRLEEQCGGPLLHRSGRRMVLSDAGTRVLEYARRLLALNDEALATLRNVPLEATVRVGIPSDVAETWWAPVRERFGTAHPGLAVDTVVGAAPLLREKLSRGELDLRVVYEPRGDFPVLWSDTRPMSWIGPPDFVHPPAMPVPLVVFGPPCTFRSAAMRALDEAGLAWSIAYQSPTLAGLWAAVASGLGITVGTGSGIPGQLRMLGVEDGLPALPPTTTALESAPGRTLGPAATRLAELMVRSLEATTDGAI
jgi:DNA-binding transcriptional LysR family regulator